MAQTDFSNIVNILGELYINYKEDEAFGDFIEFNDIGLPLAYLSAESLCDITDDGRRYIIETWELFLSSLSIEDNGFTNLNDVFVFAGNQNTE